MFERQWVMEWRVWTNKTLSRVFWCEVFLWVLHGYGTVKQCDKTTKTSWKLNTGGSIVVTIIKPRSYVLISISSFFCYWLSSDKQITVWETHLKGSVALILSQYLSYEGRVSIPLDSWTRSFMSLPHFIHSRHWPPILTPSQVIFPVLSTKETHHRQRTCTVQVFDNPST